MSSPFQIPMTLLPLLYLAATALYAMEFGGPRAPQASRLRRLATLGVLLVHAAYLLGLWRRLGHLPASHGWLLPSLLAFSLLLVYLPVQALSRTSKAGAFVLGGCFIFQLLSSCLAPLEPDRSRHLESVFFAVHVATGILALAALLLSGFFGALYLVLLRQMRRHQFGVLFRNLPDLESLSRLNRLSALMGFILLTAGVNIALAWAHGDADTRVDYLDPKVLVVLVTWIFFGVIAVSGWVRFLSGRGAAIFAVSGLTLVFLSLILASVPLGSLSFFAR